MVRKKVSSRRDFLKNTARIGAGIWVAGNAGCSLFGGYPPPRYRSPNEKLNIACIGVGGRGAADLDAVKGENIVALCDVDDQRAAKSYEKFPKAKKYHDYRRLFDELHETIDAVVIATPDHMHAPIAMRAIKEGMHVYCEKPLTHDLYEARRLAEAAAEAKVATQMGNQGTALDGFRSGVETLRSGVLGPVREVHVWTNRPIWPQGMGRPKDTPPVPPYLKWDLFLGTAPERPYNPAYHPFKWRGWWDFGTGALGDMGCHTANLAFMGLELRHPISAEARSSDFNRESFPIWSVITLEFPAVGGKPPLKWTWYDGGDKKPAEVTKKIQAMLEGEKMAESGLLVVGDKGKLYSPNDYGEKWMLLPKENFTGFTPPPPTLPRSPGHHAEWIRACKGGPKCLSDFSYAGPLTETILLGNVALYVGKKIIWDAKRCKVANIPEADRLVRREYRAGYTL